MQTIIKQTEEKLIHTLNGMGQTSDAWFAIHFSCSKLNLEHCQPRHLQIAVNMIDKRLSGETATIYYCFDRDIIVLCKQVSITLLRNLIKDVQYLFVDDPLVTAADGLFSKLTDLRHDYDTFYQTCKQKEFKAREHFNKLSENDRPQSNVSAITIDRPLLRQAKGYRKTRTKLKILVVEDHAFSRKLVIKALGGDYCSIAAENGAHAIELYADHAPDIVFLDIGLPGINGHDVLKKITEADQEAYVIMLSANTHLDDVKGAIAGGAKGFIAKPFTKQKMLDYIQKYATEHKG